MSRFVNRDGGLQELGGKALALLRMADANLPVPAWFAISPSAFTASLTTEQFEMFASGQLSGANSNLLTLKPTEEIEREIHHALRELSADGSRFAVRSSALDEDGSQHSFAGQLDTFLFVAAHDVCGKVAAVWRSGFSDRILQYRRQRGLTSSPSSAPAVLIQKMVDADVSGVAFSADPVSGRQSLAVVSAVPGLGTALVGGEAAADVFKVDRAGKIVEREIARKNISHVFDSAADEGVSAVTLSEAEGLKPIADRRTSHRCGETRASRGAGFWTSAGYRVGHQGRPVVSAAVAADYHACCISRIPKAH